MRGWHHTKCACNPVLGPEGLGSCRETGPQCLSSPSKATHRLRFTFLYFFHSISDRAPTFYRVVWFLRRTREFVSQRLLAQASSSAAAEPSTKRHKVSDVLEDREGTESSSSEDEVAATLHGMMQESAVGAPDHVSAFDALIMCATQDLDAKQAPAARPARTHKPPKMYEPSPVIVSTHSLTPRQAPRHPSAPKQQQHQHQHHLNDSMCSLCSRPRRESEDFRDVRFVHVHWARLMELLPTRKYLSEWRTRRDYYEYDPSVKLEKHFRCFPPEQLLFAFSFEPGPDGTLRRCHKHCLHAFNFTVKTRFEQFAHETGYQGPPPDFVKYSKTDMARHQLQPYPLSSSAIAALFPLQGHTVPPLVKKVTPPSPPPAPRITTTAGPTQPLSYIGYPALSSGGDVMDGKPIVTTSGLTGGYPYPGLCMPGGYPSYPFPYPPPFMCMPPAPQQQQQQQQQPSFYGMAPASFNPYTHHMNPYMMHPMMGFPPFTGQDMSAPSQQPAYAEVTRTHYGWTATVTDIIPAASAPVTTAVKAEATVDHPPAQ